MLAPVFIDDTHPENNDIATMSWAFAIPSFVSFVLVLIFVRDRPPTPPSASADEETDSFTVIARLV